MALHQIASEEDAMPDERAREASSSLIEASSIRPAEHGPSCVPADSQHYSVLTGNNIIHAHTGMRTARNIRILLDLDG